MLMKQSLSAQQLTLVSGEYEDKKKSSGIAYLLWFFFGGVGGHRYYLGDIGMGVAMTLTLGGLGIWSLIDVFFIGGRLQAKNRKLEEELIVRVRAMTPAKESANENIAVNSL